jgi:hypothetical protein
VRAAAAVGYGGGQLLAHELGPCPRLEHLVRARARVGGRVGVRVVGRVRVRIGVRVRVRIGVRARLRLRLRLRVG